MGRRKRKEKIKIIMHGKIVVQYMYTYVYTPHLNFTACNGISPLLTEGIGTE